MTPSDEDTVAVVGAGVKTPGGSTLDDLWDRLMTGRAGIAPFEHPQLPANVELMSAVASDFDAAAYVTRPELRRLDRVHLLAIGAADDALRNTDDRPPADRCAVVCGQGYPAAGYLDDAYAQIAAQGMRGLSPLLIPTLMLNSTAANLAMRYGFEGPCHAVAAACASGANAIGQGMELLRRGTADLVLAGGVEAVVALWSILGFYRSGALSRSTDPALASRPFDRDRDGFVVGEGAGFVVLQRLGDARAQGRDILGLIHGFAATCDARHLVAPREDGAVVRRCAEQALADARMEPSEIGHINAHGTSTVRNDLAEATAMTDLFAGHPPPVTSFKGVTGHMISASGAVEAIMTLRSLREGLVPPTAGYRTPDPAMSLDVVHGQAREVTKRAAISNSFGFGGHNVVLVLTQA